MLNKHDNLTKSKQKIIYLHNDDYHNNTIYEQCLLQTKHYKSKEDVETIDKNQNKTK